MQRPFVNRLLPYTALAFVILEGAAAAAAELPTFEVTNFPITPHQLSVIGSAGVRERLPAATLTRAGMAASPHQIAVLTPRRGTIAATAPAKPTTVGSKRD